VVKLGVEELVTASEALREMEITVEMSRETWPKTFEISLAEGITTYDAAYLSLAVLGDAMFVSADRKLVSGLSKELKQYAMLLSVIR